MPRPIEDDAVTAVVPAPEGGLILSDAALAAYEAMFASVPESDTGGFGPMLETIAMADLPGQLDAPWRSEGLKPYTDRLLRFESIRKAPSDFEGGLPWYLIVTAADLSTGEQLTLTTGAVAVVAQLVRAHALGALPLDATPRRSKRPNAAGYYSYHLEVGR